jgi:hypothetical protein
MNGDQSRQEQAVDCVTSSSDEEARKQKSLTALRDSSRFLQTGDSTEVTAIGSLWGAGKGSRDFEAGTISKNMGIWLVQRGRMTNSSALRNLTVTVSLGTATVSKLCPIAQYAGAFTGYWELDVVVVVRGPIGPNNVVFDGRFAWLDPGATFKAGMLSGTGSIDTSVIHTLDSRVEWAAGGASSSIKSSFGAISVALPPP